MNYTRLIFFFKDILNYYNYVYASVLLPCRCLPFPLEFLSLQALFDVHILLKPRLCVCVYSRVEQTTLNDRCGNSALIRGFPLMEHCVSSHFNRAFCGKKKIGHVNF